MATLSGERSRPRAVRTLMNGLQIAWLPGDHALIADTADRLKVMAGSDAQVEQYVGPPARVAEGLREGQGLLEVAGGLLVLSTLVAQDADHQIAVGRVAAAADRAEDVPAPRQEGQGVRGPSLLPAHLGEEQHGLGFPIRVTEAAAQCEALFEAGGRVGQPALVPAGAREPGQAVGLARLVLQLAGPVAA